MPEHPSSQDVLHDWPDDLPQSACDELDRRTREIGLELFESLDVRPPSLFQRRWWDERVMKFAMRDEALKVELFRFVDVLPMLHGSEEVIAHLLEYLQGVRDRLPAPLRVALGLAKRTPLTRAAVARAARLSTMDFARRFIAGTNVREVLDAAQRERKAGRGFTLDILGEAVASEFEAERFFHSYIELIEQVAPTINELPEVPLIDRGILGPLPRMNLSIKLSALDSQFDAVDPEGALLRAGTRLRELLRVARRNNAFINVDMESYDKKNLTLHLFKTILGEEEFREVGDVGIVIQCYLHDAGRDLEDLRDWAAARGHPVWVRLVKGAYWDYETIHAKALGWPIPVFQQKWQSDLSFERAVRFVIANRRYLRPALGTHNIRSIAHGIAVAEQFDLPRNGIELQMLYGMADAEKATLVERGNRLRVYMPYGELIPGMAYLVRRLLENTSNDSFLRAGFAENVDRKKLLAAPAPPAPATQPSPSEETMDPTSTNSDDLHATFQNQPPVDFAERENRDAMRAALDEVLGQLGAQYPGVIDHQPVESGSWFPSLDPSQTDRVVGDIAVLDKQHADLAVAAAKRALPEWSAKTAEQRADYLRQVADLMREQLFSLAAWEVYECGKGWREATNDICEAIDFCDFYAEQAIAMEQPHGANVPGEENRFEYRPRGVTAVIAPWNFPLAILTGMTVAAVATGNTVVMKPAEQSSVTAALLMQLFQEVKLPAGVVNYLPGQGAEVGAALVEHPDVALIAFTGSRQVGLQINARAAEVSAQGIPLVKRVIAEMGGKNAIIVDADADLDEAVLGVVKSAFGFQGQKCSACSRVIVLDSVYDAFVKRLVESARSLQVGPASDPGTSVGPLIDAAARDKTYAYIEVGRQEGEELLAVDVGPLAQRGYFVGPHIYTEIQSEDRLAQEEVFGPVLAVIRVDSLDEALAVANGTEYALTGGIYSRSPANLERARREMQVGNLYLNRNITGALVGRQPFGGFKMSGIGSKAGSRDYLLQFVIPRTITENTMRRGFAPPDDD